MSKGGITDDKWMVRKKVQWISGGQTGLKYVQRNERCRIRSGFPRHQKRSLKAHSEQSSNGTNDTCDTEAAESETSSISGATGVAVG